jgi:nicotinamidase/pyrazinamidase
MATTPAHALILIDIQNDFLPKPPGALPVPHGDEIIPIANRIMSRFKRVVATQDWHPANHVSFASSHPGKKPGETVTLPDGSTQKLWPTHCVENTPGAELAPSLHRTPIHHFIKKGTDPAVDGYSAFFDNGRKSATGLHTYLQSHQIKEVFIMGLGTEYCIKFTALDARQLGYKVNVLRDACRGFDFEEVGRTILQLQGTGVNLIETRNIPQPAGPASRAF